MAGPAVVGMMSCAPAWIIPNVVKEVESRIEAWAAGSACRPLTVPPSTTALHSPSRTARKPRSGRIITCR